MTQDYEPTEITESTPEPTEEGTYLLTSPRTGAVLNVFDHDSTLPFGWSSFEDSDNWNGIREDNIGYNIQSLAAHDAQIRAEALTLTDKESNKLSEVIWNYVEDEDLDAATGEVKSTLETIAKTRMEQK